MGVWAQEQSTCEIASVVSDDNTPSPFFRMINAFAEHIDNREFETRLAPAPLAFTLKVGEIEEQVSCHEDLIKKLSTRWLRGSALNCTRSPSLLGVFSLSQLAPTIDTMLVWQKTRTVNNCPDVMSRFVTALPQTKSGLVAHGS